ALGTERPLCPRRDQQNSLRQRRQSGLAEPDPVGLLWLLLPGRLPAVAPGRLPPEPLRALGDLQHGLQLPGYEWPADPERGGAARDAGRVRPVADQSRPRVDRGGELLPRATRRAQERLPVV